MAMITKSIHFQTGAHTLRAPIQNYGCRLRTLKDLQKRWGNISVIGKNVSAVRGLQHAPDARTQSY